MSQRSHPYRVAECRSSALADPADDLATPHLVAKSFLLGWSLLRLGICAVRGPDFEGFIALAVILTMFRSLAAGSLA